jgi:RecA-family ATPase
MAATYRGRLHHQIGEIWAKLREGKEAKDEAPPSVKQPHGMDALRTMAFEPIKYVVPSIIVEGLTILGGKPKIGKSWMMYHAAIAVANGGFTLGDIHCIQGDVLYCALEDNQRRLKSRGEKLLGSAQAWPKRMQYLCLGEMSRLNEGGLDMLKKWISSVPNPRLIVIDTFVAVRAPKKGNQPNFDADYESGKELQKLANEHGVAIVILVHLRKADADDPFDTVNATLGLNAIVDSILILKRETSGFSMHGRGRDLPEIEKAVTFDRDTCTWQITGDAAAVRQSTQRAAILNVLEQATEPITPNDIAAETNMKPTNIKFLLRKMVQDGAVEKVGYGKYRAKEISDPRDEP